MFNKKLELAFIGMIIIAIAILVNNYYSTKKFKDIRYLMNISS